MVNFANDPQVNIKVIVEISDRTLAIILALLLYVLIGIYS